MNDNALKTVSIGEIEEVQVEGENLVLDFKFSSNVLLEGITLKAKSAYRSVNIVEVKFLNNEANEENSESNYFESTPLQKNSDFGEGATSLVSRKRYDTYIVSNYFKVILEGYSMKTRKRVAPQTVEDERNVNAQSPVTGRRSRRPCPSIIIPSSSADFDSEMKDDLIFTLTGFSLDFIPTSAHVISLMNLSSSITKIKKPRAIDCAEADYLFGVSLLNSHSFVQSLEVLKRASIRFIQSYSSEENTLRAAQMLLLAAESIRMDESNEKLKLYEEAVNIVFFGDQRLNLVSFEADYVTNSVRLCPHFSKLLLRMFEFFGKRTYREPVLQAMIHSVYVMLVSIGGGLGNGLVKLIDNCLKYHPFLQKSNNPKKEKLINNVHSKNVGLKDQYRRLLQVTLDILPQISPRVLCDLFETIIKHLSFVLPSTFLRPQSSQILENLPFKPDVKEYGMHVDELRTHLLHLLVGILYCGQGDAISKIKGDALQNLLNSVLVGCGVEAESVRECSYICWSLLKDFLPSGIPYEILPSFLSWSCTIMTDIKNGVDVCIKKKKEQNKKFEEIILKKKFEMIKVSEVNEVKDVEEHAPKSPRFPPISAASKVDHSKKFGENSSSITLEIYFSWLSVVLDIFRRVTRYSHLIKMKERSVLENVGETKAKKKSEDTEFLGGKNLDQSIEILKDWINFQCSSEQNVHFPTFSMIWECLENCFDLKFSLNLSQILYRNLETSSLTILSCEINDVVKPLLKIGESLCDTSSPSIQLLRVLCTIVSRAKLPLDDTRIWPNSLKKNSNLNDKLEVASQKRDEMSKYLQSLLHVFCQWIPHSVHDETFNLLDQLLKSLQYELSSSHVKSLINAMVDRFTVRSVAYKNSRELLATVLTHTFVQKGADNKVKRKIQNYVSPYFEVMLDQCLFSLNLECFPNFDEGSIRKININNPCEEENKVDKDDSEYSKVLDESSILKVKRAVKLENLERDIEKLLFLNDSLGTLKNSLKSWLETRTKSGSSNKNSKNKPFFAALSATKYLIENLTKIKNSCKKLLKHPNFRIREFAVKFIHNILILYSLLTIQDSNNNSKTELKGNFLKSKKEIIVSEIYEFVQEVFGSVRSASNDLIVDCPQTFLYGLQMLNTLFKFLWEWNKLNKGNHDHLWFLMSKIWDRLSPITEAPWKSLRYSIFWVLFSWTRWISVSDESVGGKPDNYKIIKDSCDDLLSLENGVTNALDRVKALVVRSILELIVSESWDCRLAGLRIFAAFLHLPCNGNEFVELKVSIDEEMIDETWHDVYETIEHNNKCIDISRKQLKQISETWDSDLKNMITYLCSDRHIIIRRAALFIIRWMGTWIDNADEKQDILKPILEDEMVSNASEENDFEGISMHSSHRAPEDRFEALATWSSAVYKQPSVTHKNEILESEAVQEFSFIDLIPTYPALNVFDQPSLPFLLDIGGFRTRGDKKKIKGKKVSKIGIEKVKPSKGGLTTTSISFANYDDQNVSLFDVASRMYVSWDNIFVNYSEKDGEMETNEVGYEHLKQLMEVLEFEGWIDSKESSGSLRLERAFEFSIHRLVMLTHKSIKIHSYRETKDSIDTLPLIEESFISDDEDMDRIINLDIEENESDSDNEIDNEIESDRIKIGSRERDDLSDDDIILNNVEKNIVVNWHIKEEDSGGSGNESAEEELMSKTQPKLNNYRRRNRPKSAKGRQRDLLGDPLPSKIMEPPKSPRSSSNKMAWGGFSSISKPDSDDNPSKNSKNVDSFPTAPPSFDRIPTPTTSNIEDIPYHQRLVVKDKSLTGSSSHNGDEKPDKVEEKNNTNEGIDFHLEEINSLSDEELHLEIDQDDDGNNKSIGLKSSIKLENEKDANRINDINNSNFKSLMEGEKGNNLKEVGKFEVDPKDDSNFGLTKKKQVVSAKDKKNKLWINNLHSFSERKVEIITKGNDDLEEYDDGENGSGSEEEYQDDFGDDEGDGEVLKNNSNWADELLPFIGKQKKESIS